MHNKSLSKKELEKKFEESTQENKLLKKELEQKDLKIKALVNDLRRFVEKEKCEIQVVSQEKRPVDKDTFIVAEKRVRYWGEFTE